MAPKKRRNHEPYGEPEEKLFANGPDFTGHVMDSYTRLIYMQARYYDPIQGRFLSTDPAEATPGGFNRYWYAILINMSIRMGAPPCWGPWRWVSPRAPRSTQYRNTYRKEKSTSPKC